MTRVHAYAWDRWFSTGVGTFSYFRPTNRSLTLILDAGQYWHATSYAGWKPAVPGASVVNTAALIWVRFTTTAHE